MMKKTVSLISFILGILTLLLFRPIFYGHSLWNELFMTSTDLVEISYTGENTGKISFQITNNHPYIINNVEMMVETKCYTEKGLDKIFLQSNLTTLSSGQSDIFYIEDKENQKLLSKIGAPKGTHLELIKNQEPSPVALMAKNKSVYVLDNKAGVQKYPLNTTKEFILHGISCGVTAHLNYEYKQFGKLKSKTKEIKKLTMVVVDDERVERGPFSVEMGAGAYLDEVCKINCPECAEYPDWDEALEQNVVSNEHLCRLWFCKEIKKQYPTDTISCLPELYGVCLWHKVKMNKTPPICTDIMYKLVNECMIYENDECVGLYFGSTTASFMQVNDLLPTSFEQLF